MASLFSQNFFLEFLTTSAAQWNIDSLSTLKLSNAHERVQNHFTRPCRRWMVFQTIVPVTQCRKPIVILSFIFIGVKKVHTRYLVASVRTFAVRGRHVMYTGANHSRSLRFSSVKRKTNSEKLSSMSSHLWNRFFIWQFPEHCNLKLFKTTVNRYLSYV